MSRRRIKNKITDVLKLQPHKPCDALTNEELIAEEAHCRKELVRLVLSLSIHIGTCTTHGVLSAGTSLPIHVPVVVWVAYSLTKVARRHRALRLEILTNRPEVQLEKLKVKRFALPVVLGLISPILSALGADILNDIVLTLVGSDTLCNFNLGGKGGPVSISDGSGDLVSGGFSCEVVTAAEDGDLTQINLTETIGQEAIQALLDRWAEHIEDGVPEDFARLVQDLEPESISDRAGIILPSKYQVYCDVCTKQINNGFSCNECYELDLCRDCYMGMRHEDVKRHEYEEFKVEEEITQIQRIMASLRRGNIAVSSRRGGYVQCDKCLNTLSTPSTNLKASPVYYYSCKQCNDFDVCLKCFPEEVSSVTHKDHTFTMTVATDDEATISRLSPTVGTSRLASPRSPGIPSSQTLYYSPHPSPQPSPYPSLFRSDSVFESSSKAPSPPVSSRPSVSSKPSEYWCDACSRRIETSQHWRCFDSVCRAGSSVDLHIECRYWIGGMHRSEHDVRPVSIL